MFLREKRNQLRIPVDATFTGIIKIIPPPPFGSSSSPRFRYSSPEADKALLKTQQFLRTSREPRLSITAERIGEESLGMGRVLVE